MNRALKIFGWAAAFFILNACVDPIDFPEVEARDIIILDGKITDDPGPYTVYLSRGLRLDNDTASFVPIQGASIVLHSDKGESEPMPEKCPGVYQTGGVIKGTVGNSYHITVQMADGATFQSEPDEILPSGEVTEIRYQYEARSVDKPFGKQAADVFNIFIDADAASSNQGSSFVRWRFTGTYAARTFPERHEIYLQGEFYYKAPYACSGWVVDPAAGGGVLRQVSECSCCICYVNEYEALPRLSDTDVVEGGQFRNVKVGEVPITRAAFYEKYRVALEQMTITKNAYDFFRVIRSQKLGASNLFQPPPGRLIGNIKPVNADYEIIGLFWGASVHRKQIFIRRDDLPYKLPLDTISRTCSEIYQNSTTDKPADWDE
jgi:hypothetical protein